MRCKYILPARLSLLILAIRFPLRNFPPLKCKFIIPFPPSVRGLQAVCLHTSLFHLKRNRKTAYVLPFRMTNYGRTNDGRIAVAKRGNKRGPNRDGTSLPALFTTQTFFGLALIYFFAIFFLIVSCFGFYSTFRFK